MDQFTNFLHALIQFLHALAIGEKVSIICSLVFSEHNKEANMLFVVMEKGDTDLATFFRQKSKATGKMPSHLLIYYWKEMLETVQVLHKEGQ